MTRAASGIRVFLKRHPGLILIAVVILAVGAFAIVPLLLRRFDAESDDRGPQLEIVPLDPSTPSAQQS